MNYLLWAAMVTTTLALAAFIYMAWWASFGRPPGEGPKPPSDDE